MFESWSVQLLQFVVFVIVARHVDASALGLVAIALLVGQLFQATMLNGISTPLVRMGKQDDELEHTAFWLTVGLGLLLLILTTALARIAEEWLHHPGLGWVLMMLSIANVLNTLNVVPQASLMRRLRMRSLAMRATCSALGGGAVGVVMAIAGYGVAAIVWQNIAAATLGTLVLWRASPWRPSFTFRLDRVGHLMRYGRNMTITGVIDFFNGNSDVMVIGSVLGPSATGIYTVGKRALTAADLLLSRGFSRIALPTFSHLRNDRARTARAYLRVVASTSLFTTPAFVGLALIAPEFVEIFFGSRWDSAVGVMQALTLYGALRAIGIYNQSLMLAFDKPHWQTWLTAIYAIVNIITFSAAVHLGVVAVAIAFTARAYLLYPLSIYAAIRLLALRWSDYVGAVRLPVLASIGMLMVTIPLRQALAGLPPLPLMVATILAGSMSYTLIIFIAGRSVLRDVILFARGQERTA